MSVFSRSNSFYLCLVSFILSIFSLYFLSTRPFGGLFWSVIYFSIVSLLGLLILSFISMLRSTSYWKKLIGWISCLAAFSILISSIAFELNFFAPASVDFKAITRYIPELLATAMFSNKFDLVLANCMVATF